MTKRNLEERIAVLEAVVDELVKEVRGEDGQVSSVDGEGGELSEAEAE